MDVKTQAQVRPSSARRLWWALLLGFCALVLLLPPLAAQDGTGQDKDLRLVPSSGPLAGKQVYGASYALLIGVDHYATLPQSLWLEYAVKDVTDLRDVLVKSYGFPADHVRVLTNAQATKAGIEDALSDLADKSNIHSNDRILIYFSGHGQTVATADGGDQGFLIPYDAKVDLTDITNAGPFLRTCVQMNTIWTYLDSSPAKHDLVIADACYSGLLASSRALTMIKPEVLAQMASLRAMQVMTAGTKGQTSTEYPNLGHGAFTYKLLEQLKTRAATPGAVFTTSDLYTRICNGVLDLTNGKQYPKLGAHNATEGDFLFITTPEQTVTPLPVLPPVVPVTPPVTDDSTPSTSTPTGSSPVPSPLRPREQRQANAAFVSLWDESHHQKPEDKFQTLTPDTLRQSLDAGADVNARDGSGNTALMEAARWGTPEIVALLLDRGAAVTAKNKYGDTPLIEAALSGHAESVRLLIGKAADVNAKNNKGDTALGQAKAFPEIIGLLKAAGALEQKQERSGVTFEFSLPRRKSHDEHHSH